MRINQRFIKTVLLIAALMGFESVFASEAISRERVEFQPREALDSHMVRSYKGSLVREQALSRHLRQVEYYEFDDAIKSPTLPQCLVYLKKMVDLSKNSSFKVMASSQFMGARGLSCEFRIKNQDLESMIANKHVIIGAYKQKTVAIMLNLNMDLTPADTDNIRRFWNDLDGL